MASRQFGAQSVMKSGFKNFSGVEGNIIPNCETAANFANKFSTTLGPNGKKKLVVNHLDKTMITNDCNSIGSELEINHPVLNLIMMATKAQAEAHGDGTNFIMTLLKGSCRQFSIDIAKGLHPTELVDGLRMTLEEIERTMPSLVLPKEALRLKDAIRSAVDAKEHSFSDLICQWVSESVAIVMKKGSTNLAVDAVRIAKIPGGTVSDSKVVNGIVVGRPASSVIRKVEKGKVLVLSVGIEVSSAETQSAVVIKTDEELKNYAKSEESRMEEEIKAIADSGVKVIVAGGSISDMAQHFINKYGMMSVKTHSKFELRRICQAVGGTALVRVGPPTEEEKGYVDLCEVQGIGGSYVTVFSQDTDDSRIATIVLRGPTPSLLEAIERAIDDGVCTAKSWYKDPRVVSGGGAFELALCKHLSKFGQECPGLQQYAIKAFAKALEAVPRQLAESCGYNPAEVLSELYSHHAIGETTYGVDVDQLETRICDMDKKGVYDLYATKLCAIKLVVDVCITILSCDQIVMAKQAGGPKPRQ
eukprot:TRINITY_DN776027_c0_g1_i1.p1 TRINITY_DN776027_c0_g1~~TRINITY_DN776027_c0_g1_i1.p1  ORF type:complete len:543 (-),score=185.06 TRINITY_DN776027_c0_g1_i1:155-1747(-)